MKGLLYVLTALGVFGLAFWAYRENYATQHVVSETRALQQQIGSAQTRLSVLRTEWAYLNRPNRLMELAEINFSRLGLLPLRPDQFGGVDEIAYPPDPFLDVSGAVEVSNIDGVQTDGAQTDGKTP